MMMNNRVLPHFRQYVKCITCGNKTTDLCHGNIPGAYRCSPFPNLGNPVHSFVQLIRTYRKQLKGSREAPRTVKKWIREAIEHLKGCFDSTDWIECLPWQLQHNGRAHWCRFLLRRFLHWHYHRLQDCQDILKQQTMDHATTERTPQGVQRLRKATKRKWQFRRKSTRRSQRRSDDTKTNLRTISERAKPDSTGSELRPSLSTTPVQVQEEKASHDSTRSTLVERQFRTTSTEVYWRNAASPWPPFPPRCSRGHLLKSLVCGRHRPLSLWRRNVHHKSWTTTGHWRWHSYPLSPPKSSCFNTTYTRAHTQLLQVVVLGEYE